MTPDTVAARFLACFEQRRFAELAELYRDDAVFALHVGDTSEERVGPEAIIARYVADHEPPPTFLHWTARCAPWGAVAEGDAVQCHGTGWARFRWVHVLTIEDGRIVTDTVYCTGAVPVAFG